MAPKVIILLSLVIPISCFDIEAQLESWCKEPIKTIDLHSTSNLDIIADLHLKNLIHRCGIWLRNIPNKNWTSELTEIFREPLKSNLNVLKISEGLRVVDQNFFSLESKLNYLDLSGNGMDFLELPEQKLDHPVQQNIFEHLYTLDLSRNMFKNISFVKTKILKLIELDLSWNILKEVPLVTLSQFTKLEKLILSHNKIAKFQPSTGYSSIEYLDLSNNYLKDLVGAEILANLRTLIVSHNNLQIVDTNSFKDEIWGLNDLHMDHNNIVQVGENAFKYFPNLITLKLNNNKISKLNLGVFSTLERLECVDISHNFITSLDADLFATQKSLIDLNLKHNSLVTLNYTYLTRISPTLKQINVLENDFECGYFKKMLEFFMKINVNIPGGEECLQESNNNSICCTMDPLITSESNLSESETMKIITEKVDPVQSTLQKTFNISQFFSTIERKSDALIKLSVYQFTFIFSVVLLVLVIYLSRSFGKKNSNTDRKLPELEKIISS